MSRVIIQHINVLLKLMHGTEINQLYLQQAAICQRTGIFDYSVMKFTGLRHSISLNSLLLLLKNRIVDTECCCF